MKAFSLPLDPNCDGRPAWEPPTFDYSDLIEEECFQKRKALLEYTGQDIVMTTRLLDSDDEREVLIRYCHWATDSTASFVKEEGLTNFFRCLAKKVEEEMETSYQ